MQASEGYSHPRTPGEPRQRDKSDTKEYKIARGTHKLQSPDGETSQDIKDKSQKGELTNWRAQIKRQVRK